MLGAEGDDDALRRARRALGDMTGAGVVRQRLGLGVEPAGAGERLDAREKDALAGLAADAGLQQLLAPLGVAERGARAGGGDVRRRVHRRLVRAVERLDYRRGDGLDGERAGDAGPALVALRLVVEGLLIGVLGDGAVDLLGSHAILNLGVICDRLIVTCCIFSYLKPLLIPSSGWASS